MDFLTGTGVSSGFLVSSFSQERSWRTSARHWSSERRFGAGGSLQATPASTSRKKATEVLDILVI
jgi:hypothetical protein